MMRKYRVKLSKKIFLTVGGAILFVGMPISLVVACSDTTPETINNKVASVISNIDNIVPNEKGEFSEEYTGWSITAVSKDSIGKLITPKLTTLKDGDEYRLQFKLLADFIIPISALDLELDLENEGVYYSDVFTFTLKAGILSDVENIIPNNSGVIETVITGWDIIATDINDDVLTEFNNSVEYILKFSLITGYGLIDEVDNILLTKITEDITGNIFYVTELRIYTLLPAALLVAEINKITVNSDAIVDQNFVGYTISVVDSVDSNIELTSLTIGSQYKLLFTTVDGHAAHISIEKDITGLAYSEIDNTFITDLITYEIEAQEVESILNTIPSIDAIIEDDFIGWDIKVVSAETYKILDALEFDTPYRLLFSLKPNYYAPSDLSSLIVIGENYFSEIMISGYFTAEILDKNIVDALSANADGLVGDLFTGWRTVIASTAVKSIENNRYETLRSIDIGTEYKLVFTPKDDYIIRQDSLSDILGNLDIYGSYFTIKTYLKTGGSELISQAAISSIFPSSTASVTESFVGWNVEVVNSIGATEPLDHLDNSDTYYLKFTLKSGYLEPLTTLGLTYNAEDDAYYSEQETYKIVGDDIVDLENIISTSEGIITQTFNGWNIDVVTLSGEAISTPFSTTVPTNYKLKFSLVPGFFEPDNLNSGLTYNAEDDAYYTANAIYKIVADNINDLENIIPTSEGVITQTFNGWNISVVTLSGEAISTPFSSTLPTDYKLKFSLALGFLEPANLNSGLTYNLEDDAYYTADAINRIVGDSINDLENIVPTSEGIITQIFNGWNISVVTPSGEAISTPFSTTVPTNYKLKFSLVLGFLVPANLNSGLIYNENDDAYYTVETVNKISADVISRNNIYNLVDDSIGIISDTIFNGWTWHLEGESQNRITTFSTQTSTKYYVVFELKDNYLAPTNSFGIEYNSTLENWYSDLQTFRIEVENIDVLTTSILPNSNASFDKSYVGWEILLVDVGFNPIGSISNGERYVVLFLIKDGYFYQGARPDTGVRYYYDENDNHIGFKTDPRIHNKQASDLTAEVINNINLISATGDFSNANLSGWIMIRAYINISSNFIVSVSNPITDHTERAYRIFFTLDVNAGYIVGDVSGVSSGNDVDYVTSLKQWNG